jgi:phosphatidylserine decarboxylase
MTLREALRGLGQVEAINFALTNRLPRRLATRFMGWFSRITCPPVRAVSIAAWRTFCDVDLADARKERFESLHDCFVRELKDGARPAVADAGILASPCDTIVGACGAVEAGQVYQIKGLPYRIAELFDNDAQAEIYRDGSYATLRLTAGMYHHFHAPHDLRVEAVRYVYGDTWNVNPIALKRIERLFCRNERAAIHVRLADGGQPLALVAVAAILVAGIRLPFLGEPLRGQTRTIAADASFGKGEAMGWFEHGSTIIVFAPRDFALCPDIAPGTRLCAGESLFRKMS